MLKSQETVQGDPGIKERKGKARVRTCVDIVTKGAIRQMMIPALIPLRPRSSSDFCFGKEASAAADSEHITGLFLAISMTSGAGLGQCQDIN
jgi:K(+)-stimulated pyrophosphate-energized sodium pump